MAKGDHVYVKYPGFEHHAIDLGDGRVAEYGGKGTDRMSIRFQATKDFCARGTAMVKRYEHGACLPADQVVANALSRIAEEDYDLFDNNCEHFAHWCKTGHHWSPQANNLKGIIAAGAVVGVGALLISAFAGSGPPRDALGRFLPRT